MIYSSPGCSFDATNAAGGSEARPPPPPRHPGSALALTPTRAKALESLMKRITGLLSGVDDAGDVIPARADFRGRYGVMGVKIALGLQRSADEQLGGAGMTKEFMGAGRQAIGAGHE